jgi:hypothetical protein
MQLLADLPLKEQWAYVVIPVLQADSTTPCQISPADEAFQPTKAFSLCYLRGTDSQSAQCPGSLFTMLIPLLGFS